MPARITASTKLSVLSNTTPSSNKKKDGGKTSAEKERKVYKNKDAERLHQKDEEKRSHKPHNYGKKYDDRPSPML